MNKRNTDHRNMNLEQLHIDVVRGTSKGMIIWQPRIGCWFKDKIFAKQDFPQPYTGMSKPELYRKLGCSARAYEDFAKCIKRIDDFRVRRFNNKISAVETEHIIETPVGTMSSIGLRTVNSPREIKKKWLIYRLTAMPPDRA